ncbi:hypothetical protein I547_4492 [Mycobacterium kansasii 824]|nr:hypothetical protein I547_4492 [Mycobacterium kansasii 824]
MIVRATAADAVADGALAAGSARGHRHCLGAATDPIRPASRRVGSRGAALPLR